jgi:hypothetical protein
MAGCETGREPAAGNPHVRFDGRVGEAERPSRHGDPARLYPCKRQAMVISVVVLLSRQLLLTRCPESFPMRLAWMTAPAALLLSCSNPTMICACPPATFDTVVYGRVTTPDGLSVPGALVYVENRDRGCLDNEVRESERAFSHPSGGYRVYLRLPMSPSVESCLVARAEPPAGSVLLPSAAVHFEVRFGNSQPVDSARVDLVLRGP